MIFIILAIFCCMVNARVLTYTKTINKVKCTIRVNPEKGRVEVGKCSVDSIGFFDQDGMLVAVFNEDKLEAEHSYARLEFFETKSEAKDVMKIIADFEEPDAPEDPFVMRKARRNHYHRASDGNGWECDDGYVWGNDGDHCIKE